MIDAICILHDDTLFTGQLRVEKSETNNMTVNTGEQKVWLEVENQNNMKVLGN